jgi:hypothetical protein
VQTPPSAPAPGGADACIGLAVAYLIGYILVPTALPRPPLERALAAVELPLHLNWSDRGRLFDLRDRRDRARVYEIVLREGGPADVFTYVDGALLVDLWDELVLPVPIRNAWRPVVVGGADEQAV